MTLEGMLFSMSLYSRSPTLKYNLRYDGDLDKDYGKERLNVNVLGNQPMIDPLLMIHTLGFVGGSIMVRFPRHEHFNLTSHKV